MIPINETKVIRIEPGERTGDIIYVDNKNCRWKEVEYFNAYTTGDRLAFVDKEGRIREV